MTHKKTKFEKFLGQLKSLWDFLKKTFIWIKEFLAKKSVQISIAVLILVMFMLGFTINWSCSSQGWTCGGGYTPPDPDDVHKILKVGKEDGR